MGLVPTAKPPVIGQFANGRNATDDFLQLASSKGGTVFGWIDSDGKLQGTLATSGVMSINGLTGTVTLAAGTNVTLTPSGNTLTINATQAPGGANTNVQFNNSGTFGGDSGFTYDSIGKVVTLNNPTLATAITPQDSVALTLSNSRWDNGTGPAVQTNWTIKSTTSSLITPNGAELIIQATAGVGLEQTIVNIPGNLQIGTFLYMADNTEFVLGSGSILSWNGIAGGGNLSISNLNGATGASNLLFSPTANGGPVNRPGIFARNASTVLHFRLADDSADSAITALSVNGLTFPAAAGNSAVAQLIASGTAVLGTSLIASGAKASTVTVSAPGVLATDNVMADFSVDPTSTTGYTPSASGMLTIIKFCTAGNVNFIVVNNTGASITPGAVTLDFRVVR